MTTRVYLLGGYQTDFADNWARNGMEIADVMRHTVMTGLTETKLEPQDIEVAHIGNFAAELFCNQGHLGGLFAACDPAFAGLPASRHEGACASGSLAMLAASADIEAGRYGLAAVLGVEQMRNVPGEKAAQFIGGPAMWAGHEYQEARFPWPRVFSDVADEYDRRFGLKSEHLARIAEINFANGRRNRNAQTRRWEFNELSFTQDETANPTIEGRIRKQDCGQITDGAAVVFLASEARAREHAKRLGIGIEAFPYIKGWGHRTAPITYAAKVRASAGRALRISARTRRSHRCVPTRGHRGRGATRRHRNARLLHEHRVHGDRPLRHHCAGPELARDRRGRDRDRRPHSRQSERRPHRLGPPRRRDRRAHGARLLQADDGNGRRVSDRRREDGSRR